jgi:hypothetical protein
MLMNFLHIVTKLKNILLHINPMFMYNTEMSQVQPFVVGGSIYTFIKTLWAIKK